MSEPGDPPSPAAEAVYDAILKGQRDAGDIALCEALDKLTSATGQNRFRHAASVLRGTKLGRHAIDDKASLRRIMATPADRRREAVGILAGQIAATSGERPDSIARRLRRKRKNETDKLVLSAAPVE
jgi:hypothetical protein